MEDFTYTTLFYHPDNAFTMNDYLESYLPENFEIISQDGSFAEISDGENTYEVHAQGNGDSYNHRITFETKSGLTPAFGGENKN